MLLLLQEVSKYMLQESFGGYFFLFLKKEKEEEERRVWLGPVCTKTGFSENVEIFFTIR